MRATLVREHFSVFLHQFLAQNTQQISTHRPAYSDGNNPHIRVLSNALLNYAYECGTADMGEISRAIPWLGVWFNYIQHGAKAPALAQQIIHQRLVSHLNEPFVCEILDDAIARKNNSHTTGRKPAQQQQTTDPVDDVLIALLWLAEIDSRLNELVAFTDVKLIDEILDDTELLWVCTSLCHDGSRPLARRLLEIFPQWRDSAQRSRALRHLYCLEQNKLDQWSPTYQEKFSTRAQQFELSLTHNIQKFGVLSAVRLALALGASSIDHSPSAIPTKLAAFHKNPAIESLTQSLIDHRWAVIAHLHGAFPSETLASWITFLQYGYSPLSNALAISKRESINLAHYCFHLMNLCDLASMTGDFFNEHTRRALMDVEDELKEFAFARGDNQGQSTHDPCATAALARFDKMRWLSKGPHAYIADRLTRLQGYWAHGIEPSPLGAPANLISPKYQHLYAALKAHTQTLPDDRMTSLANMFFKCRILGSEQLRFDNSLHLLNLMVYAFVSARDLPSLDITQPFTINFVPLVTSVQASTSNQSHYREVLEQILKATSLIELLENYDIDRGHWLQKLISVEVDTQNSNSISLDFCPDKKLIALLDLLKYIPASNTSIRHTLEQYLQQVLADTTDPVSPSYPRVSEEMISH